MWHLFKFPQVLWKWKCESFSWTLWDLTDCSLPGSFIHGILQTRILEWVASPSSRGSSQPRDRTQVFCIADQFFTIWATREVRYFQRYIPSPYCSPPCLPHWNLDKYLTRRLCYIKKLKKQKLYRLPWLSGSKESTFQCRRRGFDLWSGN